METNKQPYTLTSLSLSLSLARDEYLFYLSTRSLSSETPTDPSRFLSLLSSSRGTRTLFPGQNSATL